MTKRFSLSLILLVVTCRRCATQYGDSENIEDVNAKNSITSSDCASGLNNFDQCMLESYGPDDYKLDENVGHVFADYRDWEVCYQNQNCSDSQFGSQIWQITVKVNGAEHEINMDEVQTAAAKCALPLLTTNINPILEKCVRAHIGKDSAWKVPIASIESLTQSIEWNRGYIPTVEAGFLTPFFDAEADIRAGYQHQLSNIGNRCSAVTVNQMNYIQRCLIDRAHHLITNNSERISTAQRQIFSGIACSRSKYRKLYDFCAGKSKCNNNISAQCKAVRNDTRRYLIECYQEVDWITIWPKIKQPYIDCVKKIPTMSFIELSSVIPFGDVTLTVDDNLQNYLRNATIGVTKKFNETFIEPLNMPNTVDECAKSSASVLGKDYDEKIFDVIEIEGTQNILLVKRTHDWSSNEPNNGTSNKFSAMSFGGAQNWCVEGGSCKTELLVQLLSRPFVRYFEVIQSFTPSYNRLSKWGINEKVNWFGS